MTHGLRRGSGVLAMSIAACALCASWTMASPRHGQGGQGATAAAPPARAQAAPPGKVDAGAALYRKVGCYQCHVNEAQGGANGPKLGPDPVPYARFSQYVRKPTGDMPPYTEKVLSAQDMADIYAFVQSRPRPPALSTLPLLAP
jgi:mono/diheme cytochrome c family protein